MVSVFSHGQRRHCPRASYTEVEALRSRRRERKEERNGKKRRKSMKGPHCITTHVQRIRIIAVHTSVTDRVNNEY